MWTQLTRIAGGAVAGLAFLALTAGAGHAARIQSVTASLTPPGQVQITVTKAGSGNCGARLLSDGVEIVPPFGFGTNPRVFSHTYTQAGTHTITAQPKKKGNLAKCNGPEKTTTVTIGSGGGSNRPMAGPAESGGLRPKVPSGPPPKATVAPPTPNKLVANVISGVSVEAGVTSASFVVNANVPATFVLHVLDRYPSKECDRSYSGPGGTASIFGTRTRWETMVATLKPNTSYHYEVCAETEKNVKDREIGTFFTGHRSAAVSFTNIRMINDGDPGISGAGELLFFFWVNGNQLPALDVELSSGDDWNPNTGKGLPNVGEEVRIEVAASEADSVFHAVPGAGGVALMHEPGGDRSDKGRAKGTVLIIPDSPGGSEAFTKKFSFLSDYNGVQFRVEGNIKVRVVNPN